MQAQWQICSPLHWCKHKTPDLLFLNHGSHDLETCLSTPMWLPRNVCLLSVRTNEGSTHSARIKRPSNDAGGSSLTTQRMIPRLSAHAWGRALCLPVIWNLLAQHQIRKFCQTLKIPDLHTWSCPMTYQKSKLSGTGCNYSHNTSQDPTCTRPGGHSSTINVMAGVLLLARPLSNKWQTSLFFFKIRKSLWRQQSKGTEWPLTMFSPRLAQTCAKTRLLILYLRIPKAHDFQRNLNHQYWTSGQSRSLTLLPFKA